MESVKVQIQSSDTNPIINIDPHEAKLQVLRDQIILLQAQVAAKHGDLGPLLLQTKNNKMLQENPLVNSTYEKYIDQSHELEFIRFECA